MSSTVGSLKITLSSAVAESDSPHSSRREKLAEHIFLGEVLRNLWCAGVHKVDVLRAETDAVGYDKHYAYGYARA